MLLLMYALLSFYFSVVVGWSLPMSLIVFAILLSLWKISYQQFVENSN